MGELRDTADQVYRLYVVDKVKATGENEPDKKEIRELFGMIEDEFDALAANQSAGVVAAETWAVLAGFPTGGRAVGDFAKVVGVDAGTHTDPVVGGTVDNRGLYRWSASPAGFKRVGDLDADDAADSASDAAASAAAAATSAATAGSPGFQLPTCVTAFYPCDEGGGLTVRDLFGGTAINLTGKTGVAWTADGALSLTNEFLLTPSKTARAMFIVVRQVFAANAGYVMASPSGKAIGQALSGGTSFTSVRSLSAWGVHTLKARTDTSGSNAYELNSGGWVVPLATLTADETGTFVIGAANTAGAGKASYMEVVGIGLCSTSPSASEADQIRNYLRRTLKGRSVYIAAKDCPTRAKLVVIAGESTSEGTMPLTGLSADERATVSRNAFIVALNSASQSQTTAEMKRLWFGTTSPNNNAPSSNTKFGMEWGLMLAQNAYPDDGAPVHYLKPAQGSTYSLPSGSYTDATGAPASIGTAVSRNADEFTSTTNGLHYGLEVRNVFRVEGQGRNKGIGYTSVTFIENDGLNDAYIGSAAVTGSALVQGWLQDRYDAREADYGISNVQQIQIYPHLPQGGLGGGDPDYPNTAVGTSRLAALTYWRAGAAAFVAANAPAVVGLDSNNFTRYPLNNSSPNTDWTHWDKTGFEHIGVDAHALIKFDVEVVGT